MSMSTAPILTPRNLEVLRSRQVEISEAWASAGLKGGAVAILDFPRHQNAGDSLIYSGERSTLRRLGIGVSYVTDIGRYDPRILRRRTDSSVPILMHGGGNFGDLWPVFQDERERVVGENPDRKIVILPQTVYFASVERAKKANAVLRKHRDLVLFVRDYDSLHRARVQLPDVDVRFCHDSALGNDPFESAAEPSCKYVVINRLDRESAGDIESIVPAELSAVTDWGLTGARRLVWGARRAPLAAYKRLPATLRSRRSVYRIVDAQYDKMISLNLCSAVEKLSVGQIVVSNRLHAHVLAILMGKKTFVLENNYGKISPIASASLDGFDGAKVLRESDLSAFLDFDSPI